MLTESEIRTRDVADEKHSLEIGVYLRSKKFLKEAVFTFDAGEGCVKGVSVNDVVLFLNPTGPIDITEYLGTGDNWVRVTPDRYARLDACVRLTNDVDFYAACLGLPVE